MLRDFICGSWRRWGDGQDLRGRCGCECGVVGGCARTAGKTQSVGLLEEGMDRFLLLLLLLLLGHLRKDTISISFRPVHVS